MTTKSPSVKCAQVWPADPGWNPRGGSIRFLETILAVALLLFVIAFTANTRQLSDSEYTAQAISAAPEGVAKAAGVVRMGVKRKHAHNSRGK